jgi:hypothetical protein
MARDPYLYRITYNDDSVKHGRRNVLGPVVGHARNNNTHWHKRPAKIERVLDPEWEDVTALFLTEDDIDS